LFYLQIVHSPEDIRQQIAAAERLRKIRVTNMGMSSSQAHSVFTIHIEQKALAIDGTETIILTSDMKFVESVYFSSIVINKLPFFSTLQ
jgi:hypothetical protein